MILSIERVLSAQDLAAVERALAGARFVDGALSASAETKPEKHVSQLDRGADGQREIGELVVRALLRHPTLQAAVLPKSTRHPTVNRYGAGMHYGPHVDAPIMGGSVVTRADVSATVFLNEPGDYEGGELCIHADKTPFEIKGRAGDCVIYSADSIHRVKPVTLGVRVVAVTWFQSLVRGQSERRILFDLKTALDELESREVEPETLLRLRASYGNLLRLWAEP